MDDPSKDGQSPVERPVEQDDERFNPFQNEADMFKILLWVGGGCLVVALLMFLGRSVF